MVVLFEFIAAVSKGKRLCARSYPVQHRTSAHYFRSGNSLCSIEPSVIETGRTSPQGPTVGCKAFDQFIQFLEKASDDNKHLSFQGKQQTIIIWVEPSGLYQAYFITSLISEKNLPIRIGFLPIKPGEKVVIK